MVSPMSTHPSGVMEAICLLSSLNVMFSCICALVQSLPIRIIVGQSSFDANWSFRCCRPSIDAMTSFDGTSLMTLGRGLCMKADGKGIGFSPSIDETTKSLIKEHGSGREVPCTVEMDKFVGLTSAVGIFNSNVMDGSTIVTLDWSSSIANPSVCSPVLGCDSRTGQVLLYEDVLNMVPWAYF